MIKRNLSKSIHFATNCIKMYGLSFKNSLKNVSTTNSINSLYICVIFHWNIQHCFGIQSTNAKKYWKCCPTTVKSLFYLLFELCSIIRHKYLKTICFLLQFVIFMKKKTAENKREKDLKKITTNIAFDSIVRYGWK